MISHFIYLLVLLGGFKMFVTSAHAKKADSVATKLEMSPVIRTMTRELNRSVDKLHLKGSPKPYFISYLLWDVQSFHMQASLGTCEFAERDRQHFLDLDLRVGDYHQDNSNFQGGIVFGPHLRLPLPVNNDTTILALSLWAATDSRYKIAIEQIAQKKAFLANHNSQENLDDFSRQKVLKNIDGDTATPPDSALSVSLGKELSKYLGEFSWLGESRVGYQYYYTTFYYVDSEGARYIQTIREHTLLISLFTQATDGAPLWDYLRVSTRTPLILGNGAASLSALKDSLAPILKRLQLLRTLPPLQNYRGPVLFTGSASGELLNKALLVPQTQLREPLGAASEANFMISLAGRKLFPTEITVIDTPAMETFNGHALFGHYTIDHQGQRAKNIVLVKEGRVQDYFAGKVPVVLTKGHVSNGHWRYRGGYAGVTIFKSSKPATEAELFDKLSILGLEEGTGYGLVVSKVLDEDAFKLLHHPLAGLLLSSDGLDGRGSFTLNMPCELDQLDSRTGKKTPVRGLSFPVLDSKSLRDVVASGDKPYLHEPQASFSILCPALLFSLLDLKGTHRTQPHLPLIP